MRVRVEGLERRCVQAHRVVDDELAPKGVDRRARLEDDVDEVGLPGDRRLDKLEPDDDPPGVVPDDMAPSGVALVRLLRPEVDGAKELAVEVADACDLVEPGHVTAPRGRSRSRGRGRRTA